MREAPIWTDEDLRRETLRAIEVFRSRRIEEPLEDYLEAFDQYRGKIETLLESTVDLLALKDRLPDIVSNSTFLNTLRYFVGPPISRDDLETVAEASLTSARLQSDVAMTKRVADVVLNGLDRRRFPWVHAGREPTEAERNAAVVATAALMATRRLETNRRTLEKRRQEAQCR